MTGLMMKSCRHTIKIRMQGTKLLVIAFTATTCLQQAVSAMTSHRFAKSIEAQQENAAISSIDVGLMQEKADVPTQLYQDSKYGLSFKYPSVWTRITKDDQGYFGTKILGSSLGSEVEFRAAVKSSSSGNVP